METDSSRGLQRKQSVFPTRRTHFRIFILSHRHALFNHVAAVTSLRDNASAPVRQTQLKKHATTQISFLCCVTWFSLSWA